MSTPGRLEAELLDVAREAAAAAVDLIHTRRPHTFGMVTKSIPRPGFYSSVMPVEDARTWRRIVGRIKRLDTLAGRVAALEGKTPDEAIEKDEDND